MWLNNVQIYELTLKLVTDLSKQKSNLFIFFFLLYTSDRTENSREEEGWYVCSSGADNVRHSGEDKGSRYAANVRTSYHLLAGPWSMCNVLVNEVEWCLGGHVGMSMF